MFGPKSECSAKVGSIGNLVRFDGGDTLVRTEDATGGLDRLSQARRAELSFKYAGEDDRFIAARLGIASGAGCDDTIWGRSSELPSLPWRIPKDADSETAATLEGALRASPAWAETQREYAETRSEDRRDLPESWERYEPEGAGSRFLELTAGDGSTVAWGNIHSGNQGAADFEGSVTGFGSETRQP